MRLPSWSRPCALVTLLALATANLLAQRQVAFDDGNSVFVLTRELETRARLFDVEGFEEARIYLHPDSTYLLEITLSDSLGFRRTTRILTQTDVTSLRQRWTQSMGSGAVATQPASRPPSEPLSEEGRSRMVQTITGLGIGWYGWTLPALVGSDEGPLPFTLYLLTAGATYLAADAFLADRSYSDGEAAAFMYFATRGILHGYALNTLLTGDYGELRSGFPAGTLVSLAEGLTLSRWAAHREIPVGRIKAIGTIGDAGLLIGLGAAYTTSSHDRPFFDDAGDRSGPYASAVLSGNVAGLLLGLWISEGNGYGPGDADLMESSGYLGAAAGFTIADLAGVKDRRSLVLGAMSGLVAGQLSGGLLASNTDLSSTEGRRVGLLTSGGVLIGLGVGYAIDQDAHRSHYWSFATLGGVGGFLIARAMLGTPSGPSATGASWQFHPDGLVNPVEREEGGMLVRTRPFATLRIAVR